MTKEKLLDAIEFVQDAHNNRALTEEGRFRKKSSIPYFTHVIDVMKRLSIYGFFYGNEGFEDEYVTYMLLGGLGHDLIEDTDVTYDEIVELWGEDVANLILSVTRTEGDSATKLQKWEFLDQIAHCKDDNAILLKIADRYCNVMDYTMTDYKYAAKYALQAHSLLMKFREFDTNLWGAVEKDVITLDSIIKTRYQKSFFEITYEEAKSLVT